MPGKLRSTVSAAKKAKLKSAKSAVKSRVKGAKSAVKSRVKGTKSTLKSTVRGAKSAVKTKAPSAKDPVDPALGSVNSPQGPTLRGVLDTPPLGEQIDAEQQAILNAPDGANIYDPAIGYGTALPGETGVAAVERIKLERASLAPRAKVKKRK